MNGIEELRRLAEKATPGPWSAGVDFAPDTHTIPKGTALFVDRESGPSYPGFYMGAVENKADAAYIAAASPDVILRLLDVAEKAAAVDHFLECEALTTESGPPDHNTIWPVKHAVRLDELHDALRDALTGLEEPVQEEPR